MAITAQGITGHTISAEEFELLGLIDSRLYLSSSTDRFAEWDSSFAVHHPDWPARVKVQSALSRLTWDHVATLPREADRKIIFLGASKGTIASYFHLAELARADVVDDFEVTVLDFLWEPLLATQRGEFEVPEQAVTDIGVADVLTIEEYRRRLAKTIMVQANVCETGLPDVNFDVVVAPYIQHHLNFFDKRLACAELVRICKPGGHILLGDLTFTHESFQPWLAAHAVEAVPYALESFIGMDEHIALFGEGVRVLEAVPGSFYYSAVLQRLG